MRKTVIFAVYGDPRGKARPRFDSRHRRTFTPKATQDYEKKIREAYLQEARQYEMEEDSVSPSLLQGPLYMVITAGFRIPKSASKIRRAKMIDGQIRPTKVPDVDNIAKIVQDALNGYAYKDDAQIVQLLVDKHYTKEDPYVAVMIEELLE